MKHLFALLLLLGTASVVQAQDVIVKKDGSTVICRVIELNATEIVYKKWNDLNGANYIMDRSLASVINYENGKKETLGEVQNQYTPGNQNDGVQQYNDRALLELDKQTSANLKAMKTRNTLRWIGGGLLTAFTGMFIIGTIVVCVNPDENEDASTLAALGIDAVGIWGSYALLKSASKHQKQIKQLSGISLYQREFKFHNGTSISIGTDYIADRTLRQNTLGLGLRYNF